MPTEKRWIWPFKLDEKIGEGGMGVVYRARYVKNDRLVAVKLLPPDLAADTTILARFEREMEVLKELKHPHIVHCFGGVCEDDRRFYAMELVDGGSIDRLIAERGSLRWEQVVEYGLQLCSALAFAHKEGFIHRDVKPANLLLTRAGKLKLSDFGLAHVTAAHKLTAVDRTVGTYCYMAPEQIRGKPPVSPQTDLYALGCVLFEMLTGRPPFTGETPAQVLHQHLQEPPPRAASRVPEIPAQLDHLVADLLEKKPEHRPASGAAVALRLQQVTQTIPASVGTPERGVRNQPVISRKPAEPEPGETRWQWTIKPNRLLIAAALLLVGLLIWTITVHVGWFRDRASAGRATALWIEAYHSESTPVRLAAARALGKMGAAAETVVPVLRDGLSDESPLIRSVTAEALGNLGAHAKSALAALVKVQRSDPDPQVRLKAAEAVKVIRSAETPDSMFPYFTVILLAALAVIGWIAMRRPNVRLETADDHTGPDSHGRPRRKMGKPSNLV